VIAVTTRREHLRKRPERVRAIIVAMKAQAKRQKQELRERERRQQRTKIVVGAVVAVIALGLGLASFSPGAGASKDTPAAAADSGFRRITIDELKPLFDRGQLTVIDVRDADAYAQSHIPGALQIPLEYVSGEASYLPKDRLIVTYCTCPAEESSGLAVQVLASRGVTNAAALVGGLKAWTNRGYPLDAGIRGH
jgi:rhodanese-related sulfurtransferase